MIDSDWATDHGADFAAIRRALDTMQLQAVRQFNAGFPDSAAKTYKSIVEQLTLTLLHSGAVEDERCPPEYGHALRLWREGAAAGADCDFALAVTRHREALRTLAAGDSAST